MRWVIARSRHDSSPTDTQADTHRRSPRRRYSSVYYESLKRELRTKTIYGFRCDERLKTKVEESTRLTCTLLCTDFELFITNR